MKAGPTLLSRPYTRQVPRNQHHPTPEERDERVTLDLPSDEAIRLIMDTGENPEDEDRDSPKK